MFLPSSCSKEHGTVSCTSRQSCMIKRNLEISIYLETKLFIGTWGFHVPPVNVDKVVLSQAE